jgi:hypothetical protein
MNRLKIKNGGTMEINTYYENYEKLRKITKDYKDDKKYNSKNKIRRCKSSSLTTVLPTIWLNEKR